MAVFGAAILKSVVLNISNCNRNVGILVKMRGLKMSGDIPFTEIWDVGGA